MSHYENFEIAALRFYGVEQEFRHGELKKKRKLFAEELRTFTVSEVMSAREKKIINVHFIKTVDNLSTYLQKKIDAYTHVLDLFSCCRIPY